MIKFLVESFVDNSTRPLNPTELSKKLSAFGNGGILVYELQVVNPPDMHFINATFI